MKPETKFWHEIKKNSKQISWTRLENLSAFGTPDLLGYNTNSHFFTVELKVTRANKIKFSPHQIAFHIRHPDNTFILGWLVRTLPNISWIEKIKSSTEDVCV